MKTDFLPDISHEEIRNLELRSFPGEIVVVENLTDYHKVISRLEKQEMLGFDTETKPSFRKGRKNKVSLLQLSDEKTAYLFRINKIGIPDELKKILCSREKTKIGVAIHDDLRFLGHISRLQPEGFVDLQKFVREFGIESAGLKKLVAIVLGFRISKSQQVTDWEAPVLSEAQIAYAATDAWVCLEIYRKLVEHKKAGEGKSPGPDHR
ncbi:MAG TPA: 3'-5' exonuclease [Bacteroidales bacterium]|nr:3'-5' exonuclease [Bacteroidales bacterium]